MATKKDQEYEAQVLQWQAEKYASRKSENGWVALVGLYWLNEGRNLVGSNPMCEVILPERAPTFVGIVELKGKTVRLTVAEGVQLKINGRLVQKAILKSSQEAKPSFITWNETLRMVVHEHAGKYAIRIWDNERPERFSLRPSSWFPVNKHFRIPARYTRYKKPLITNSPDADGTMVEDRIDGYVTFRFEGKTYKLDATEMEDRSLFIKFRDLTSKKETYPPSRYYYTEPVKSGKVTVDFNYSYSPPCAFTAYATCTFAPPQNDLPFRVEAGEIYRG
ncbi:MAG: DUF1684 domain-containing protein [Anaerolineales bacterium]|nr:DUF1684 domain-containing protein [Anaerolineales bacterium]